MNNFKTPKHTPGPWVPADQTPLNSELDHKYLAVIREGAESRRSGGQSPYNGHSLEHCLHAFGWVQQDLRMALDAAKADLSAEPELLEALDFMVNVSRSTPGFSAMAREQAERAIAKARGEA